MIAQLGGFLARKGDGEPGVKSLWLGMSRLRDFALTVEHMRALGHEACVVGNGMTTMACGHDCSPVAMDFV